MKHIERIASRGNFVSIEDAKLSAADEISSDGYDENRADMILITLLRRLLDERGDRGVHFVQAHLPRIAIPTIQFQTYKVKP